MTTGLKRARPYRWELPEQEIARHYREGVGMEPLGDLYCVTRRAIHACLIRQKEPIRNPNKLKATPAGVAAEYREHGSLAKVAALHGVAPRTVKRWLTGMGIEINRRGGPNNPTGKSGPRHAGSPKHRRGGI